MTDTPLYRWPDDVLPPFPMNDSYKITFADLLQRTDFEQGPARQRNVFASGATLYSITIVLNPIQLQIFTGVYFRELHAGADWFEAPVFDGPDYTVRTVRFVKGTMGPPTRSGGEWMMPFVFETNDDIVPDATTLGALLLTYGTTFSVDTQADSFHATLHVSLPGAML